MLWPFLAVFALGLAIGLTVGMVALHFSKVVPLRAKYCYSLGEILELREFNKFCIDHASQVLTRWQDYKQSMGMDEEDTYG